MPSFNSFTGIGHLARGVELRQSNSGKQWATGTIAINDYQKKGHFFDFKAFGKTAEMLAGHFEKGDAVGLDGEIAQETWEDKSGQKRSKVVIIVRSIIFLGRGANDGDQGGNQRQQPRRDANMGNGPSDGYAQDLPDDGYEPPY